MLPQTVTAPSSFPLRFPVRESIAARLSAVLTRGSLGLVFLWFGALKLANESPVVTLLEHSFAVLARTPWLQLLGFVEILIAVGLVVPRLAKIAAVAVLLHLCGTLSVAVVAPQLVFAPRFPVLTMEGEFILKNVVLMAAAMAVFLPSLASSRREY
jgi:uncharacterized membrane protein YkgB